MSRKAGAVFARPRPLRPPRRNDALDPAVPERIGDTGVLRWPGTWRVYVATRSEEIKADTERALTLREEAGQLLSVGEGIGTHLAAQESYARAARHTALR